MIDVVLAAKRYLEAIPAITNQLGSDATYANYIFRWRMFVSVEGKGLAAIVLKREDNWITSNTHNTMQFPRIMPIIYVDDTNIAGDTRTLKENAEPRAMAIWEEVDKALHRPQRDIHVWGDNGDGGRRVLGSLRYREPILRQVQGSETLWTLESTYALVLG